MVSFVLRKHQAFVNSSLTQRHLIIDKDKGDGGEQFKIRDKDIAFNSIEDMLTHYEKNAIDPDFKNIGRKYTEDEYMKDKICWCCTLL